MERDWTKKAVSAEEAVGLIQSGMNVFVHGAVGHPDPAAQGDGRAEFVGRRAFLSFHAGFRLTGSSGMPGGGEACARRS